jgi:N6-adenosine-specific RNA methylase IME4
MSNETPLVLYENACRAVAEAKTVDECKSIRDKAVAMQAYARQAKNRDLEADALEIRMRATRHLDQLRQAQKQTVGLATGGEHGGRVGKDGLRKNPSNARPTLAEQGIDKNLATAARKLGALAEEDFEHAVGEARAAVSNVVRDALRAKQGEARRAERVAKIVEASRASAALPTGRRFPVLLADPPWHFENYAEPTTTILHGRAADQYKTMTTERICALPVRDLATEDAVLFLWTTSAHLMPDAVQVLRAWGFEYKTNLVWVKDKRGVGFWIRNQHELLLVCTRGDMPTPAPADRPSSVIEAPRREHSRKPDEVYAIVEHMFPDLPRVELFARGRRAGWEQWGNQLDKFDAA